MLCSNCGTDNPATAKFCIECASPFARRCPSCAAENPPHAKFCAQCATHLRGRASPASPTTPAVQRRQNIGVNAELTEGKTEGKLEGETEGKLEGERKMVTALFADIKGSMELMEDLDAEEARAIVDPALKLMIDAVHRYGGFVVQSTGDGVFALFGAPVAHEDHAQRALYAALWLQDQIRRYSARLRVSGNLPIEARVGVNTGEAVVRSIATSGGHAEYTPIGHSTNLAARMQALAPTGSIAATDATRKLCEGYFIFKSLGPTVVKGVSEPVVVHEVTGLGPLRTRLQHAAARGLTRFVGREREIGTLKHALTLTRAGRGQIVATVAEAGIGKSRLFYEFKATSQSGCMVLEAYSVSHGKASAYLPVVELLKNYFEITPGDEERKRREKITGKVLTLDRGLEDILPFLLALLDVHGDDDSLTQLDPETRRRRTQEAIKRVLVRESLNQPLIVIFEDLHWIDTETQALINLLVEALATVRILLLVNYRPEYQHPWSGKTYYLQLRLDPLPQASAGEMLTALLGDEGLPTLRRLIIDKSEGNPFFMEEIVRALFEQGVLVRNGLLKVTSGLKEISVSSTVQAVLASRIDRLPSTEKELLQTLAVIGRDFQLSLVRHLVATSDEELERSLTALQTAEFIYEQPASGGVEYTFKHALTQEVAYNSVLLERRKALHEWVGQAIESLFAERLDDHVTELAHHYVRSTNADKAVEYLGQAARKSLEQAAHSEVVGYVNRALELLKRLPEGVKRARHELELCITLGVSLHSAAGVGSPERKAVLARALELCEQLGDPRKPEVMLSLGSVQWSRSEPLLALQVFEQARALAEEASDAEVLAAAHVGIGIQLLTLGQFEPAREHFERAIDLSANRVPRSFGHASTLVNSAPFVLGLTLLAMGYPVTALKISRAALDTVRQRSSPFMLASALTVYLCINLELRDVGAASEHLEELVVIAAAHEMAMVRAFAAFYRAWSKVDAGAVMEGLGEMRQPVTQLLGTYPPVEWLVVAMAEVCGRTGRADEGLAIIKAALTRSEKIPHLQAELYRLRGDLSLLRDSRCVAEAERCLGQAIEIARRQSARLYELRATTSLARLLMKQGSRDEAHAMLAEVYNWFIEGFDTADLKEAKALLDELSV